MAHHVEHDAEYYRKCMIGGALACGLTHTGMVPLDVVKCNMQTQPAIYTSTGQALSRVWAHDGLAGLTRGWLPTFFGYHVQGMFKYGFNEFFKDYYGGLLGEDNAKRYRRLVWAAASASAEFIADVGLCPFEMVKVRVQVDPTMPSGFSSAASQMWANRAVTRFPYGSIVPLWTRQVPYTIAKFVGFEQCVELFYKYVFTKDRSSYAKSTQLGVTFASGYIAGVFCALVSQPADNIVSQMGRKENAGKSFGDIARAVGIRNLFLKGLGARVLMVGGLTGFQWWIYDTYKVMNNLGTTGGGAVNKKASAATVPTTSTAPPPRH